MQISAELEQALHAYLQARPWKETNALIVALAQARRADQESKAIIQETTAMAKEAE